MPLRSPFSGFGCFRLPSGFFLLRDITTGSGTFPRHSFLHLSESILYQLSCFQKRILRSINITSVLINLHYSFIVFLKHSRLTLLIQFFKKTWFVFILHASPDTDILKQSTPVNEFTAWTAHCSLESQIYFNSSTKGCPLPLYPSPTFTNTHTHTQMHTHSSPNTVMHW